MKFCSAAGQQLAYTALLYFQWEQIVLLHVPRPSALLMLLEGLAMPD